MLTEEQIEFLNRACPNVWVEENGIINVNGNVDISCMKLSKIPVDFAIITGFFNCEHNQLTTLSGSPIIVLDYFNCFDNKLTTLENGPKLVKTWYSCSNNNLTNLIGAPEKCKSDFYCRMNQLTSLEGCPKITNNLICEENINLHNLYGIDHVQGDVYYDLHNDLNKWIIQKAKLGIKFNSNEELTQWIKNNYIYLKYAPNCIRQLFSQYELHYADILC